MSAREGRVDLWSHKSSRTLAERVVSLEDQSAHDSELIAELRAEISLLRLSETDPGPRVRFADYGYPEDV